MTDSAFGEISLVSDGRSGTEAQYVLKLTPSFTEGRTAELGRFVGWRFVGTLCYRGITYSCTPIDVRSLIEEVSFELS